MRNRFGRIRIEDGKWVIACEPQVRARLKRWFARVEQHAALEIAISNTPENCRDLEAFLTRYPMDVTKPAILAEQAEAHRSQEERLISLFSAKRRDGPPISLQKPPREYQTFAANMVNLTRGLLLADDVGLGKTITAICSLVQEQNLPAVCVVPTHLPSQWEAKIAEFAPALSTHIVNKGTPYPIARGMRGGRKVRIRTALPDVLIINYFKLRGWAEALAGNVKAVVFDEVQQLRNTGEIHTAAKLVATHAALRLGLSATPIYNYGSEFFWVCDVLRPGALGTREEFIREWCVGAWVAKARISNTDEFGSYLRREGIMLRRTRKEVGRELPPVQKVVHEVETDESALSELKGDAVALARTILAATEKFRGERMQASAQFENAMRQATGIAKAPFVADFVRLLLESEERVVLFGWHREVYSLWLERLKEFNPVLYTGTESPTQKKEAIRQFLAEPTEHERLFEMKPAAVGRSRVLIMSLRSGAGVDGLQGSCSTVVFGEIDWSPGIHDQCVGRIHRDGQRESCVAYYLVADDGADPIMIEVLGVKREQLEGTINPDRSLVQRVDTGENNIKRLAREYLAGVA